LSSVFSAATVLAHRAHRRSHYERWQRLAIIKKCENRLAAVAEPEFVGCVETEWSIVRSMLLRKTVALPIWVGATVLAALLAPPSPLLAANPDRGRTLYEQCAACHTLADEAKATGPSLKNIFGRKAGLRDDFRYSVAMQRSVVVWTAATLDQYIADPQAFMRGNRMAFAGIADKLEREDLIAYLEQATK
jgi:cytochrome c